MASIAAMYLAGTSLPNIADSVVATIIGAIFVYVAVLNARRLGQADVMAKPMSLAALERERLYEVLWFAPKTLTIETAQGNFESGSLALLLPIGKRTPLLFLHAGVDRLEMGAKYRKVGGGNLFEEQLVSEVAC
jgi:hypothetical protein